MNKVIDTILSRRSVRHYQSKQITADELDLILKAGAYAPSAMNQQSWFFAAVQNEEIFAVLRKKCGNSEEDPFYGAPTVVLVFGDSKAIAPDKDGSLALENMFLAAASLGIGSCWINSVIDFFATEEGKAYSKAWGIPADYHAVGSCILGYPAQEPELAAQRLPNKICILR